MADYRTEEEQIEILKTWWRENGRSTVIGVVVALVGYFGWAAWHSYQQSKMEAAADLYQQMAVGKDGAPAADKNKVTAAAEQLRKDYPGSVYAIFAALHLAKDAVDAKDFPRAAEMLAWAAERKPDASLAPLVTLRLAQVQYAQGQHDAALATLTSVKDGGAWKAALEELRGDVLLAQNRPDMARNAYGEALKALDDSGAQERRQNIEMKLAELAEPVQAVPATTGGKS